MSSGSHSNVPNYYKILQLARTRSPQPLAKEDVKTAYHRALLLHHPDKSGRMSGTRQIVQENANVPHYSIDQIGLAYKTLADPVKRKAYDEELNAHSAWDGLASSKQNGTHSGVETVDLEDLPFDETTATWHHSCRCGDEEGYVLTEAELEHECQHGEVHVGCRGCSLFIKVVFGVAEEDAAVGQR